MWKAVEDFPKYEVSDDGRIRNRFTGHILSPWESTGGYLSVRLCENGKEYTKRLHRLVAKAFCENTSGRDQVNHKDGNKKNNAASNLEWCNMSENMIHAFRNGLQTHIGKHPVRKVVCITDGRFFETLGEASEYYGIDRRAIYACCSRKSNRSKYGLIFRFAERRDDA